MGIVTGCAVKNHTFAGPVGNTFAMGTAQPVAFLAKMALTAKQVTVVEVYFSPFLVLKIISLFKVVTINAVQSLPVFTVI